MFCIYASYDKPRIDQLIFILKICVQRRLEQKFIVILLFVDYFGAIGVSTSAILVWNLESILYGNIDMLKIIISMLKRRWMKGMKINGLQSR